ncbi:NUDIX domain-containing protein [Mesoaciditoga sp.]
MLSKEKYDEVIRFVLRKELEEVIGKPTGFIKRGKDENLKIDTHFAKRGELEEDESKLQVIPYVVFEVSDDDIFKGILTYVRKGSEDRLLNKLSVGFGGHSNMQDKNIQETACREIKEEIGYPIKSSELRFAGYIFSDNDAVSRVHVGYVYIARMSMKSFENLEISDEIKKICLYKPKTGKLQECDGIFENWSSIILNDDGFINELMR